MDQIQHLAGILFGKRFQRIQSITITGKPHRYHRYALKLRHQRYQIPDRTIQFLSIVHPTTKNNLAVHHNARFFEPSDLVHHITCKPVVKHFAAKFRIGRLKGNINRGKFVIDNFLQIMFAHIGKCQIISLKERKTGIIILKVKSIPHAFGQLVDKAEHALISAGTVIIHQTVFKFHSQIVFIFFFNLQFPLFAIRLADHNEHFFFIHQVPIVKDIFRFLSVDRYQHITRFDLHLLGNAARSHCTNNMFHL